MRVCSRSWAGPAAQKRELLELQAIYMDRGLTRDLARQVCRWTLNPYPDPDPVENIYCGHHPMHCCADGPDTAITIRESAVWGRKPATVPASLSEDGSVPTPTPAVLHPEPGEPCAMSGRVGHIDRMFSPDLGPNPMSYYFSDSSSRTQLQP